MLKRWLYNHVAHPYPTEPEKHGLMAETGLDLLQVCVLVCVPA